MNGFANSSHCGNCRQLGANDVRQKIMLISGLDTMIITIIIPCMVNQRKSNQKEQHPRRRKSLNKPPILIKKDPFLNWYLNLFVPDFYRTVMCGIWIQVVLNT